MKAAAKIAATKAELNRYFASINRRVIGWHFQLSASVGPVDVASRPTPYLAGLAVLAKAARYILGLGGEKMEIVAVEMAK